MLDSQQYLVIVRRTLAVLVAAAILGAGAAHAATEPVARIFKLGPRTLQGRPKTICVITGSWADGAPFRYEAWDRCEKMKVRTVTEKDFKDAPSLGEDDEVGVKAIPRGAEVIEMSNGTSTILIFRDAQGMQRHIRTQD